jgi:hypothetical protein
VFAGQDRDQDPDPIISNAFTLYCSLYSFFLGFVILAWEHFFGRKRGSSRVPLRGIVYTILSLFLFVSWPTLLPAFFLFSTGVTNFVATGLGEVYDAPPKAQAQSKPALTAAESDAEGIKGAVNVFFASVRQQNKTGRLVFMLAYVGGNIALFAWTMWFWSVHNRPRDTAFLDQRLFLLASALTFVNATACRPCSLAFVVGIISFPGSTPWTR